jgi:hypothetical protein
LHVDVCGRLSCSIANRGRDGRRHATQSGCGWAAIEKWEKGIKNAAKFSNAPVAFYNNNNNIIIIKNNNNSVTTAAAATTTTTTATTTTTTKFFNSTGQRGTITRSYGGGSL